MKSAVQAHYNSVFDATIGKLWIAKIWDNIDRNVTASRQPLSRIDFVITFGLGVAGMMISIWAFTQTNRVPGLHTMIDIFLHADVPRLVQNMVSTDGDHGRTIVHPVRSLLLYPFTALLTALGMDPLLAAKTFIVLTMGANAALFGLIIRLLGLPRVVVLLFTALFMLSASFLFWSGIVEGFTFSCFSVLSALFLMFRINQSHWGWWVTVNVLTFGFIITNWMFGLIATAVRHKLKPFIAITIGSFLVVVALSIIQNTTFKKAALFFNPEALLRETQYLQPAMELEGTYQDGWRPDSNLRSMYVTTIVAMPTSVQEYKRKHVATTNQNSGFPTGEVAPVIAVISWVILFGMGIWGSLRCKDLRTPLIGATLMLAAQTALHLVYGEVTFLYSLSFLPLLVLFASMAWFAPYRPIGLSLAGCVILLGGLNNERRLQETINLSGCLADTETVQQIQTRDIDYELVPNEAEIYAHVNYQNLCDMKTTK